MPLPTDHHLPPALLKDCPILFKQDEAANQVHGPFDLLVALVVLTPIAGVLVLLVWALWRLAGQFFSCEQKRYMTEQEVVMIMPWRRPTPPFLSKPLPEPIADLLITVLIVLAGVGFCLLVR